MVNSSGTKLIPNTKRHELFIILQKMQTTLPQVAEMIFIDDSPQKNWVATDFTCHDARVTSM